MVAAPFDACLPDPGRGRLHLPLGQPEEREAGLGVVPVLVGPSVGLIGPSEVAYPASDLPDLVVGGPQSGEEVEPGELLARHPGFLFGPGQGAPEPHELGLVDSAHPGERRDGLTLAPPQGGLGPLRSPPVVPEL
jgi:hypothetical protein